MIKIMLFVIAIPAFIVLLNSVCSINAMNAKTHDCIRWANIFIAIGSGAAVMSAISSVTQDYWLWHSVKLDLFGFAMVSAGHAAIYLFSRRNCECKICSYSIEKHKETKEC